jgi:hypothetical protein
MVFGGQPLEISVVGVREADPATDFDMGRVKSQLA